MPSSTLEQTPTPPTEDPLARFRTALPLYSAVCLRIRTKTDTAELAPLRFRYAQKVVHAKISAQRAETGRVRAVVLKARQEGVSTYTAARNFRAIHLWRNLQALVIADEKDRSGVLFDIYDRFYDNLPEDIRPRKKTSLKRQRLALWTGSELAVETAGDEQAGRTMTIHRLHISELAAWEHAEDTWISVLQAVPDEGSEVIVESTAQGVGNKFHRLWKQAESGDSEWLAIFLPWWIHEEYGRPVTELERAAILRSKDPREKAALRTGIEWDPPGPGVPVVLPSGSRWSEKTRRWRLTPEQLAWRRRVIRDIFEGDERGFRQEYPSTAREAFLVSGNCFFDEEKLLRYEERATKPVRRGNLVRLGERGFRFEDGERGYLHVWEEPSAKGHYVIAADTAEGRMVAARDMSFSDPGGEQGGRDFCSADVVRAGYWRPTEKTDAEGKPVKEWVRPRTVAQLHGRMAPEVFAEGLWMLGNRYSCPGAKGMGRRPALIAVERNHGSGQMVLRILREELRYPNLFWHRRVNQRTMETSNVLGWVTDVQSRPVMLDEWSRALRAESVDYPITEGITEHFTFVRNDEGKPEAQEGCHDDRVISASIAWQMLVHHHHGEPKGEVPEVPVSDRPTGW